jgi:hypothetical protein
VNDILTDIVHFVFSFVFGFLQQFNARQLKAEPSVETLDVSGNLFALQTTAAARVTSGYV